MSPASFAATLDAALISAPWSLDRIVEMLTDQGLRVSQATLSHWRTGRSMPKRHNSLRIVAALEDILDLAPHSLSSLLYNNNTKENIEEKLVFLAPTAGKEPDTIDSGFVSFFDESDNATDWHNEIQREFLEEEVVISADFLSQTHTFVILARVPQTKNPCLHVSIGLDDTSVMPETGYIDVYNVKGATIGERKLYTDGHTTVTRLDLPTSCYPGQLHRISYTYSDQSTVPFHSTSIQGFAWPFHFYVRRIEFEGKVPEKIEWVEETTHEKHDKTYTSISTRTVMPIGNTVQICIEKPTSNRGYFRWN